jgi:hypothetical protein
MTAQSIVARRSANNYTVGAIPEAFTYTDIFGNHYDRFFTRSP